MPSCFGMGRDCGGDRLTAQPRSDDHLNVSSISPGSSEGCVFNTLVPRATLCGVAELHVASGMPQWRMFVTSCYI